MKYRNISLFLLFTLFFFGCGKEELDQNIPWAPVEFEINLGGQDHGLNNPITVKIFTANRLATDRIGFSGLIVFNTGFTYESGAWMLFAYDRCCPHEGMKQTIVVPSKDNLTAQCTKCKTVYSLTEEGAPKSGVGTKRLQRYRCTPDGGNGEYRIWR